MDKSRQFVPVPHFLPNHFREKELRTMTAISDICSASPNVQAVSLNADPERGVKQCAAVSRRLSRVMNAEEGLRASESASRASSAGQWTQSPPLMVGIELRRASRGWRVIVLALSIARR